MIFGGGGVGGETYAVSGYVNGGDHHNFPNIYYLSYEYMGVRDGG